VRAAPPAERLTLDKAEKKQVQKNSLAMMKNTDPDDPYQLKKKQEGSSKY
jgi:hypothetical protein